MNWLTEFVKPKLSSLVNKKQENSDLCTTFSKCNLMLYKSEHEKNLYDIYLNSSWSQNIIL